MCGNFEILSLVNIYLGHLISPTMLLGRFMVIDINSFCGTDLKSNYKVVGHSHDSHGTIATVV